MPGLLARWLDHGPEPVFVPEEERNPDILYTKEGYEVSGKLTRDRAVIKMGIVVFCILFCSWSAQWAAFALPYWRGDKYHTGGLFQICGTQDLKYVPSNHSLVADPSPNATYPYRCQGVSEYVATFKTWVCLPGNEDNDFCQRADAASGQIHVSRWFEALTTVLDMIFGLTTIGFMIWPDRNPKASLRNGWIALAGIIATPWFCLVDLFLQNSYWDFIGVGFFDQDARNFLHGASQATIATSCLDFAVQFAFLQWAVHRHGWKFVGKGNQVESVGLGPAMQMRKKRNYT
ncbi:hypothetical protein BC830DRAFT_1162717 [Chytriomyces sp. MP71]|nr:hypothetical protein BC830DRAFT_1162717 [Chytriomyces sp. MP71]